MSTTKEYSSVQQKIVEHHKIESVCKKIAKKKIKKKIHFHHQGKN